MSEDEMKEAERALKIGFCRIFGGDFDEIKCTVGKVNKYGAFDFTIAGPTVYPDDNAEIKGRSTLSLCRKVYEGCAPWLANKGELY